MLSTQYRESGNTSIHPARSELSYCTIDHANTGIIAERLLASCLDGKQHHQSLFHRPAAPHNQVPTTYTTAPRRKHANKTMLTPRTRPTASKTRVFGHKQGWTYFGPACHQQHSDPTAPAFSEHGTDLVGLNDLSRPNSKHFIKNRGTTDPHNLLRSRAPSRAA